MIFRVASNPGDYNNAHSLMQAEGIPKVRLGFPTLLAIEDGTWKLVGILGTRIEKKMVIAGPLVLRSDQRRIFTAIRLAEAYEMSMRNLGIKSFIFYGEAGGLLERAINRYYPHMEPYAVRGENKFWIWRSADGRRRSNGSPTISGGEGSSGSASGSVAAAATDDSSTAGAE